jgi:hypothetical protein
MKDDETDEACSTHGTGEKFIQNFRDNLEDIGVDGRII